ncbi:MAG: hypothetical protein COU10_01155 [Candidatus Harrisonbacteria bacterium CG10_big_fil_rev_8_21_14_0_10_45_28]|uniref:Carboxypeptidase regulatory-like domain-containing protein n=1 Tax=Candidatus Harrisonbacteria bacterium CG10_big_fil_rev_8_21_14_0_10_45_28 TaxID=1974586 RepID=A0A2H0UNV6_9BACT|nr:MAG: hypothetical protein COU10_01155 [Candidatus Harrisonbacteria bacterium CG10_big_fil_rev_8_21_14_0_10_45_28]
MENKTYNLGFSLIEVLIAMSVFLVISFGIYFSFANVLEVVQRTEDKTLARALLDREIENLRSLAYEEIGVEGGYPAGILPASRELIYENKQFTINAYVRNVDDPFDGVTGGSPNDTAPADYKVVELQISCANCLNFISTGITTWVGPEGLETASNNGSLFIHVFDANGVVVAGASVVVVNNALNPTITIYDSTDNQGNLKLVDVPPSINGYEIYVSKSGYSSAQTYEPGEASNPNPVLPHATVATQNVTELSLAIDKVSTVNVRTQDFFCDDVGGVKLALTGERLIGSGPDVLLTEKTIETETDGELVLGDLTWDKYTFLDMTSGYDMAGSWLNNSLVVDPDTKQNLFLTLHPDEGNALLVRVVDETTGELLGGQSLVGLSKIGFSDSRLTGQWQISQTDWSSNDYYSQDGNIESEAVPGEISLVEIAPGTYASSTNSWLISKIYEFGTSTTEFNSISWEGVEPAQAGQAPIKFQVASNDDLGTWTYVGPDGTGSTYFTSSGTALGDYHDGNRYLRYRVFLNTENVNYTPILEEVSLNFSSGCVPSSQSFWPDLSTGTYNIIVTKSGYLTATSTVDASFGWQQAVVEMTIDE